MLYVVPTGTDISPVLHTSKLDTLIKSKGKSNNNNNKTNKNGICNNSLIIADPIPLANDNHKEFRQIGDTYNSFLVGQNSIEDIVNIQPSNGNHVYLPHFGILKVENNLRNYNRNSLSPIHFTATSPSSPTDSNVNPGKGLLLNPQNLSILDTRYNNKSNSEKNLYGHNNHRKSSEENSSNLSDYKKVTNNILARIISGIVNIIMISYNHKYHTSNGPTANCISRKCSERLKTLFVALTTTYALETLVSIILATLAVSIILPAWISVIELADKFNIALLQPHQQQGYLSASLTVSSHTNASASERSGINTTTANLTNLEVMKPDEHSQNQSYISDILVHYLRTNRLLIYKGKNLTAHTNLSHILASTYKCVRCEPTSSENQNFFRDDPKEIYHNMKFLKNSPNNINNYYNQSEGSVETNLVWWSPGQNGSKNLSFRQAALILHHKRNAKILAAGLTIPGNPGAGAMVSVKRMCIVKSYGLWFWCLRSATFVGFDKNQSSLKICYKIHGAHEDSPLSTYLSRSFQYAFIYPVTSFVCCLLAYAFLALWKRNNRDIFNILSSTLFIMSSLMLFIGMILVISKIENDIHLKRIAKQQDQKDDDNDELGEMTSINPSTASKGSSGPKISPRKILQIFMEALMSRPRMYLITPHKAYIIGASFQLTCLAFLLLNLCCILASRPMFRHIKANIVSVRSMERLRNYKCASFEGKGDRHQTILDISVEKSLSDNLHERLVEKFSNYNDTSLNLSRANTVIGAYGSHSRGASSKRFTKRRKRDVATTSSMSCARSHKGHLTKTRAINFEGDGNDDMTEVLSITTPRVTSKRPNILYQGKMGGTTPMNCPWDDKITNSKNKYLHEESNTEPILTGPVRQTFEKILTTVLIDTVTEFLNPQSQTSADEPQFSRNLGVQTVSEKVTKYKNNNNSSLNWAAAAPDHKEDLLVENLTEREINYEKNLWSLNQIIERYGELIMKSVNFAIYLDLMDMIRKLRMANYATKFVSLDSSNGEEQQPTNRINPSRQNYSVQSLPTRRWEPEFVPDFTNFYKNEVPLHEVLLLQQQQSQQNQPSPTEDAILETEKEPPDENTNGQIFEENDLGALEEGIAGNNVIQYYHQNHYD